MNTSKHTDHTKDEILKYLEIVKKCVNRGSFTVSLTEHNEKNILFIEKYKLSSSKVKQMLLELEVTDFCYSVDNYNFPQERLYIFCRKYELNNWGWIENIEVYVKIALKRNSFAVIVSFHTPEKKIQRLFE